MIFTETPIKGSYKIELEPIKDRRGFFVESFSTREFEKHGLENNFKQSNISYNTFARTLRGMHYESSGTENKLVRCSHGTIYDVLVDLRKDSETYCKWFGLELSAYNMTMLYVPKGCAHGFITLVDGAIVCYQISQLYDKDTELGVAYNDPIFDIKWPVRPEVISDRDRNHPRFIP